MRRGEIWWADLPAPAGRRPVLLLSRDTMPIGRGEITVAYLTTTIRHRSVEVPLTPQDGVAMNCVVNLDSINTIPKSSLRSLDLHAVRCKDGRGEESDPRSPGSEMTACSPSCNSCSCNSNNSAITWNRSTTRGHCCRAGRSAMSSAAGAI